MKKPTVYIDTFGCSLNISDTEYIIDKFLEKGFTLSDFDQSDVIVVNTCGVKEPTENKIITYLTKIDKLNKKKIIAGCLPKINLERIKKAIPSFNAIIGPASYSILDVIIDKIINGEKGLILLEDHPIKLKRFSRINEKIGIVPIAYGCLGNCTYCCVRFARGKLRSFPIIEVVEYISQLVNNGCTEIWLTAQDTAAYGLDIGANLPKLLQEVELIPGKFKVRIGMMNPKTLLLILNEFIEAFKGSKIYKFLHLPIQSGNNEILEKMGRSYTIEEVKDLIKNFKKIFPELTISTDVIAGFPGETDNQFKDTIEFLEYLKPSIVNISKYGDRPKASSPNLKNKLRGPIVKSRSRILTDIVRRISLENNSKWINWKGEINITEKAPKDGFIGRNFAYKPILIRNDKLELGVFKLVNIIDFKPGYLIGKIIESHNLM